jgi:folate-binding protein YgfZ
MSNSPQANFCELTSAGLIAFSGEDAAAFLHAQLTSDVAGLGALHTQYSGYCSPKGRLLATFILWRRETDLLLQVPASVCSDVQQRLSKYVLRSRVRVTDLSATHRVLGISGMQAPSAMSHANLAVPAATHEVVSHAGLVVTRLPENRYVVIADLERATGLRASLAEHAQEQDENAWSKLDIEAGIPVITTATQELFVPQMVNLDAIGGVSYTKGCYPGQEIVARTHYLGKLKARMYRIRVIGDQPVNPGDPLFSPEFGEQASGTVVQAVVSTRGYEALAVVQIASARADTLRLSSQGPPVEFLPLPYATV